MRIEFKGQEEKYKITVMAILLASACALTYYFHTILGVGTVFSHFFYIPIILASLWWRRKCLVVAVFLAGLLILGRIFLRSDVMNADDYLRALMLVVVAFVAAVLSEQTAKAEEALRETRDYLENLLGYANAPIIVWDPAFRITRFNHAFERLTGRSAGEVVGAPLNVLFPDDGREEAMAYIHRAVMGERWEAVEIPILRVDGTVRIVLWNSATLYAADGTTVIATIAQGQDVTERKRAEQEIRQRAAQLEALRQVGPELAVQLDLDTLLRSIASRAVELLGDTSGGLYLYQPEQGVLEWVVPVGSNVAPVGHILHRGEGLSGKVWETGEPLIVDDYQHWEGRAAVWEDRPITALVGVPVRWGEEFLGVLNVQADPPRTFSPADTQLLSLFATQAAIAIRNARLYGVERKRVNQLAVVNQVAQQAASILDPDRLLQEIVTAIQQGFEYHNVALLLLDEAASEVEMRAIAGGFEDVTLPDYRQAVGVGIVGWTAETGQSLLANDVSQEPRYIIGFLGEAATKSELCVPLKLAGRVIGVLDVQDTQLNAFDETDLMAMETLADQIAVAIENARLYEETQRRAAQAALVYEVGRRVTSELEPGELLSAIVTAVRDAFDYYGVMLMLLDEEAEGLTLQSIAGGYADIFPEHLWLAIGEGMIGYAAATGETQVSGNVSKDPHYVRKAQEETKSELAVPIKSGQEVIGVLDMQSDKFDAFDEVDLMAMETLADQIAVAIENARLFEETRRRVRELRLLHDVGLAAASGVRLGETLQAAAVALAAELESTHVALMLLEPESGSLRMEASVGYPPDVVKGLRLRLGQGITGWVAQHGEPLLVPDVGLDPRYYEAALDTRSELCVPMSTGSLVIGVLNVESPQPNVFTDDDQRLLSTLASNLTVLIERARLFEEVEAARMELQQRAEALEQANVRLQELDRLKSQLLANMSHELRTPLNSILGFSEVLMDGLVGEMTPDQNECLGNIHSSGQHLLALINDILDLSKIEAGRMELEPTTFDVAGLLAEVQMTIMPLIKKKSQVLKIGQAEGLPRLTADRFRIKQVLLNLLSNAYKFTLVEGHITLSCRLVDGTTMLFSVADTGFGIKPEDHKIIFEEFRQADGSSAREMTGTGLGLAISKRLIEMHGGRIWVESEYGHGATFSFLLPLVGPPAAEAGAAGETEQPSEGKTVLVVEDNRQFSDLLAFYLRQEGYIPVQHYNGVSVLEKARELRPALITLDIMLPDQDGWDVLRVLKSDPQTKDIPVLVISALEDGELAFSLGAVDYLVKPIRREDLHRVLDRLAATGPLTRHVTVLVVDDDPGVIKLLQQMLPADSCTLLAAYDGRQGLTMARSERLDAILLDLLMPGMSGFEVLEALRADAETADIPVIVLTARDVTEGERKLLNDHIQGLMRKSTLTPKSLLAELRRLEALRG